jgi:hypothetical protein
LYFFVAFLLAGFGSGTLPQLIGDSSNSIGQGPSTSYRCDDFMGIDFAD